MGKLLTISVAAYNVEKYLEKALNSCIVPDKYYEYLEVLIVNDGSTDKTLELAHSYERKYPQIFTCINKENGGYGSTINAALNVAKGKYFRLLDGDDWYDNNQLVKFIDSLIDIEADLVLNNFSICYQKTNKTDNIYIGLSGDRNVRLVSEIEPLTEIAMYSFCYRTDLLRRNNICITEKCFYTDIEFLAKPLIYIKNYVYIDNTLYQYRIGVDGQSVSFQGMQRHHKDAELVMYQLLDELDNGKADNNVYVILVRLSALMLKMCIKSKMCSEISNANRKYIINIDKRIKKQYPEVYKLTEKSYLLKALRLSHYWIYPIWVVAAKMRGR